MIKKGLSYDDTLLVPQYSDIRSRSEIDLSVNMGNGLYLTLPILSAPMDTVTESDMAIAMCNHGGAGIIHRYNTMEEQERLIFDAAGTGVASLGAALGVSGDYTTLKNVIGRQLSYYGGQCRYAEGARRFI